MPLSSIASWGLFLCYCTFRYLRLKLLQNMVDKPHAIFDSLRPYVLYNDERLLSDEVMRWHSLSKGKRRMANFPLRMIAMAQCKTLPNKLHYIRTRS